MNKKYDIIIGIDPDVDASGFSTLYVSEKKVELNALKFPHLLDELQKYKDVPGVAICVEAGWLIKGNWHTGKSNSKASALIGNYTGRNHETGMKIVEMCKHYGLNVIEIYPLRKDWRGKDGKISHEELDQIVGGLNVKKSNQEMRDAGLIAWYYSGLPIRINYNLISKKK